MINPVIIFGAKGVAHAVLDVFVSNDVVVYGFLDDDESLHGTEIGIIPILGDTENEGYTKLIGKKCDAFVAYEEVAMRKSVTEYLLDVRHTMPCNAIHKHSGLAASAKMGHGNYIGLGASVNAEAQLGNHNYIGTNAVVDYNATLGDFCTLGAGATVGAGCTLAHDVFVGAGATIVPGIKVGKGARIGAGSVVVDHIKEEETVFGNPAKKV